MKNTMRRAFTIFIAAMLVVCLCACGSAKLSESADFSACDEITIVLSDETTAVLGENDLKTVKDILSSGVQTEGTDDFDGGISLEIRKDGAIKNTVHLYSADKITVDDDTSVVFKITDEDYKSLEKIIDNYKL